MAHHFNLSKYTENGNLLGREKGGQILTEVQKELDRLPVGETLLLDFQNINYTTHDCLIEILSVVIRNRGYEFHDKYILLKLDSTNHSLIDGLNMIFKERNCVIPSIDEKGNWKVLGCLTKAQRDTVEAIVERGEVTSTEIGEILDIQISAASNRLKDLYDMKLVMREERTINTTGGRQFVYRRVLD